MFTGIVEELGEIAAIEELGEADPSTPGAATADSARLRIRGPRVTADAKHGDSIAVNGVCLTVVEAADGEFTADVMAETLRRSSLGALAPGSPVNLERPMALGGRLGGHLVQGHVDGTGVITERVPGERWEVVTISLPSDLARYVVDKGSITVDGISLTVVEAGADHFTVSLIPTTLALTTLGGKRVGDPVNLEVDVLAKYVERLLAHGTVPGAGVPVPGPQDPTAPAPAQGTAPAREGVAR
ncbi:riboflavin synthase [Streptomyces buecherae]|uniref:riboflavin synthase n=1 Tax=Streptomyces buecherae TaxID=2763006 RepID=UPI0036AF8BFB